MQVSRRTIGLLVAGLLATTGCAAQAPGTAHVAKADGPAIIRVQAMGDHDPLVDGLIEGFQNKYSDYRVERVKVDAPIGGVDCEDQLRQLVTEERVDVLRPCEELGTVKLLMPLDPFIERNDRDLNPPGESLDQRRVDGTLYELPVAVVPRVVAYNSGLLQSAGVSLPAAGWTWEQFRESARRLTGEQNGSKV